MGTSFQGFRRIRFKERAYSTDSVTPWRHPNWSWSKAFTPLRDEMRAKREANTYQALRKAKRPGALYFNFLQLLVKTRHNPWSKVTRRFELGFWQQFFAFKIYCGLLSLCFSSTMITPTPLNWWWQESWTWLLYRQHYSRHHENDSVWHVTASWYTHASQKSSILSAINNSDQCIDDDFQIMLMNSLIPQSLYSELCLVIFSHV